jgi:putative transposase
MNRVNRNWNLNLPIHIHTLLRSKYPPQRDEFVKKLNECRVEEGHLMPDHVHMLISIPPKMSVAAVMGFMKGKSAIHIARVYAGRRRSFIGQHFWARGYWVSTVGRDEESVRRYIQEQEKEDLRLDQLELKLL